MNRWIDADALSGKMFCEADMRNEFTCYESIERMVETAPYIDIVRCSECNHYIMGDCSKLKLTAVNKDSFCSWGERRDDE